MDGTKSLVSHHEGVPASLFNESIDSSSMFSNIDDIGRVPITVHDGQPILVSDIGTAVIGERVRSGIVGYNERDDVVEGIVDMTKGQDPADVFAKAVNDLHAHIVGKRGLTMLMWADRLIDGKQLNMGEWEASKVGTAAAIDKIPKDIILCPWHYELREHYESLPMFMGKGFRILPASWKNTDATLALIRDAQAHQKDGLLVGHIFTTWSQKSGNWSEFEPPTKGLELLNSSSNLK